MNRKIIYVFNPIAGGRNKDRLLKKIESATRAKKIEFEIIAANSQGNYKGLRNKIEAEKITDIVIVGGDGTVNQITGSIHDCNVRFGIIPAGSGNGLAYTAGISKNIDIALQVIFNQNAKCIDAFLVNDYYCCMLSGLGFDAVIADKFATGTKRGLTTYIQQSLLHFLKAPTYAFEIITGEFSFFTDAYFISIANSNQFGNNVTIAPKAKLNDGLLDIIIVQKMHKAILPFALLKQVKGNYKLREFSKGIPKENVLYFQVDKLIIRNPDSAPLHIDGDPYKTAKDFEIKIIKNCFELIQP